MKTSMGRTERAARLDGDSWHVLVEQSPEPTILCDHDLGVLAVSDGLLPAANRDLRQLIHTDDLGIVQSAVRSANPLASFEILMRLADGLWHTLDCRLRLLELGPGATDHLCLISARDVTADRNDSVALLRRIEVESLLERVQHRFISAEVDDADEDIATWALRELGRFLDADRSYIVEFDHTLRTESMTHEWCSAATTSELESYQRISFDALPGSWRLTDRGGVLAIADVATLGDDWEVDREAYRLAGVRSILGFTITIDGQPFGELGFDWLTDLATWTDDDLTALQMFSASFAQLFARRESERQLARSLEQLRMAFDGSPVPLALVDTGGVLLEVNAELATLLGRTEDDLVGSSALSIVEPEFREQCITWGNLLLSAGQEQMRQVQVRLVSHDEHELWAEITPRPNRSSEGNIVNFVLQVNDITSALTMTAALAESEVAFSTLVNNLPDPLLRIDREGNVVFWNQRALDVMLPKEGTTYGLTPEMYRELTDYRILAFETNQIQVIEHEMDTLEGRRTFESRFVPEPHPSGEPRSLLIVATDLTDRKRTENELAHRAGHDELTDLPNRSLFLSHLNVALSQVERSGTGLATVIFFDLDQFKNVNDSLGHACGDELLVAVARRMSQFVRPGDVVSRLGGDEFTVLLTTCTTITQAISTAARMQQALLEPIEVNGRELIVTVSGGVAVTETGKESAEDMMAWADAAMYCSKDNGRNRITLFDDTLAEEVRHRLDVDQKLRVALEKNEFEVYLQPEVDLITGAILGAEALLRWRTEDGIVAAAQFIEVAEKSGIIVPIGWWVLEEACREAASWTARRDQTERLVVRVNLSAKQIDEEDLVHRVESILRSTGLPPEGLCLEITETALMSNALASRELLKKLDALGVELAIDDFGTGYSSLSYLKQFPADVLKIDKSFVDGLPGDPEDTAIVTTIIRLADSLGLTITAEGIESQEQADRLVELGCHRGQGYHFARPMPIEEFRRLIGHQLIEH